MFSRIILRTYSPFINGIVKNKHTRRLFTKQDANTQITKIWNLVKVYRLGVIGGIGTFTGVGIMWYCFYPTIHKTNTKTASDVINSSEVYRNASDLSKNITNEILQDENTSRLVSSVLIKSLKNEEVRKEFNIMLNATVEDPVVQEFTKKFVIGILKDPETEKELTTLLYNSSQKLLADPNFQQNVRKCLRNSISIKDLFW